MHQSAYISTFAVFALSGSLAFAQQPADVQSDTSATEAAAAQNATATPEQSTENSAATAPAAGNTASTDGSSVADSANTLNEPQNTPKVTNVNVMTDAMLDKQLREVSTSVDTLKEDTFTTKSRLLLLREEVLQRSMNGSRLQIRHKNDMGGQYEMVQIYYAIDHEQIYAKHETDGSLNKLDDEILYDSLLVPGAHQLTVLYVYKGKPWGVFRYMTDYTFKVESGYDFVVDEGKAAELIVTASESGNFFTAYEERPSVTYDYKQYDLASAITSEIEAEEAKGK